MGENIVCCPFCPYCPNVEQAKVIAENKMSMFCPNCPNQKANGQSGQTLDKSKNAEMQYGRPFGQYGQFGHRYKLKY